ncbi:hypothetical protein chiPu_0023350, partial [Chiloscyllium punctatum]|nr:hypothetical protein [Chiloscyllium punctatum]
MAARGPLPVQIDALEGLRVIWLQEFYQVVNRYKPHFLAVHCQEIGGKDYEVGMEHVDKFVMKHTIVGTGLTLHIPDGGPYYRR